MAVYARVRVVHRRTSVVGAGPGKIVGCFLRVVLDTLAGGRIVEGVSSTRKGTLGHGSDLRHLWRVDLLRQSRDGSVCVPGHFRGRVPGLGCRVV